MSTEPGDLVAEALSLLNDQDFTIKLLREGDLPDGWADLYLSFIGRVEQAYGCGDIPRPVVAALYGASVYSTKRYWDWQRSTDKSNDATWQAIQRVRWAIDGLLMCPFFTPPGPQPPSSPA